MIRRFVMVLILAGGLTAYFLYQAWLARQPYEWSGTIEAHADNLGSHVGGRVKDVLVAEGDKVEAGAALVVLEPGDLDAQRASAQGQIDLAEAALKKLEKGARHEQVDAARARVDGATVALADATTRATRAATLFAGGAATQADRDSTAAAQQVAAANLDAAKKQLDELHNGAQAEDVDAARAQLAIAQARLTQLQVAVDELTVKAPRPGHVEALPVRPGDILAPNAVAATLVEDDQLYVRIYIPETQLGHLPVGSDVPVTVDAFPGRTFKGHVDHINTVGEYSPRNLQTADERADEVFGARVTLVEGADVLRAGMAAFLSVPK